MFRFALKAGIAGGVVYYIADQGVWKDSDRAVQIYRDVTRHTCPYIKQATDKLPFELPTIPKTESVTQLGRYYWNSGVKAVFQFLVDSPTHVTNWSKSAYGAMAEFTKTPQPVEKNNTPSKSD